MVLTWGAVGLLQLSALIEIVSNKIYDNVYDKSDDKIHIFQKAAAECKKVLDGTGIADGFLVEPHNACKQAALEDFLKVNMIRIHLAIFM